MDKIFIILMILSALHSFINIFRKKLNFYNVLEALALSVLSEVIVKKVSIYVRAAVAVYALFVLVMALRQTGYYSKPFQLINLDDVDETVSRKTTATEWVVYLFAGSFALVGYYFLLTDYLKVNPFEGYYLLLTIYVVLCFILFPISSRVMYAAKGYSKFALLGILDYRTRHILAYILAPIIVVLAYCRRKK